MLTTKTEQTEQAYLKRADSLIEQYLDECKVPYGYEFEPLEVVKWAIHKRQLLRAASWRQYRSSLVFHFESIRDTGRGDPIEMDDAIRLLKNASSEACVRRKGAPRRTSSSKKRSITPEELQLIVDYLDRHASKWSFVTSIWLQTAVLTGLRPSEWQSARLELQEAGMSILKVLNAKKSNGRANGDERTLILGEMTNDQIILIKTQIEIVLSVEKANLWDRYYRDCRRTLNQVTRALWPNRVSYPSLYSGRHQFAANAKKAGLSKIEVAALMGHASDETAGSHYGKKRSGVAGMTVTPSPSDVARLVKSQQNVTKSIAR
jgi:integrase